MRYVSLQNSISEACGPKASKTAGFVAGDLVVGRTFVQSPGAKNRYVTPLGSPVRTPPNPLIQTNPILHIMISWLSISVPPICLEVRIYIKQYRKFKIPNRCLVKNSPCNSGRLQTQVGSGLRALGCGFESNFADITPGAQTPSPR